jgi:hypothetical protein
MKMKIKTTELQGEALNRAVAYCVEWSKRFPIFTDGKPMSKGNYSTDWALGGPIIEQENISVFMDDEKWAAYASHSLPQNFYGTSKDPDWDDGDEGSPLVAAMRCYVASVLGDEVEVPDETL